jgi:hypothetical protein
MPRQYLTQVSLTRHRIRLLDRSGGGAGGGPDGRYGISPYRASPDDPVEVAALLKMNDVRCNPLTLGDGSSKVTSQSNLVDRQAAALQIFRSLSLGQRASQGSALRVTYADDGTEDWLFPAPTMSNGGNSEPIAGTLKPPSSGAGIPKENKLCVNKG